MGKNLTRKILEEHLVVGEYIPGKEIGIKIDQTLLQDATDSPPQTSSLHQSFIESRLATADRPVVAFCMRKDDPFPEDTGNRSDHVFGFSITAVPSRTQIR